MPSNYKLLSYHITKDTPLYANFKPLRIREVKRIQHNDSCNISEVSFINHIGTHIDAPRHFYDSGHSVSEYCIEEFIFNHPYLCETPKKNDELILPKDIRNIPKNCDILFFRTRFYKYRNNERYEQHNPGISPEAARLLRLKYPTLRAVGIDAISFSCFQKREIGRVAHRILLKERGYPGHSLFLIEDLNLSGELNKLKKVFTIPLFVDGVDSSPCTVIGVFS